MLGNCNGWALNLPGEKRLENMTWFYRVTGNYLLGYGRVRAFSLILCFKALVTF